MQLQTSTFFSLMAEFGTGDIPLNAVCEKYFGLSESKAGSKARHQQLPVPVYRGGSQKSMWLINTADLATYIDKERSKAKHDWERIHNSAF